MNAKQLAAQRRYNKTYRAKQKALGIAPKSPPPGYRTAATRKHRLKQFGLTPEDGARLFKAQKGLCAICQRPETRIGRGGEVKLLALDHNHATGALRKLLCYHCNLGLGHFQDSFERLLAALDYLHEHR